MTDKETNELVYGLCRKDRQAQWRMLQTYGEMIFGQVARIVTCQEDAEEVYQDVFVKVFSNIRSYDSSKASLSTWLSRIAYNESINFLRRNKPPVIYVEDSDLDRDSIMEEQSVMIFQQQDEQAVQTVERALDYLPPDELALITMFYFDDMSIKDIAFVTDSISSTVASRLSRTRNKLYRIIKSFSHEREG